jgi:non-specific serine/threonine protein kinase
LAEKGLELARGLGDAWLLALSLWNTGLVALADGRLDSARSWLEEGLALTRRAEARPEPFIQLPLGWVAEEQHEYDLANSFYEESLALARAQGNAHFVSMSLRSLGSLALERGDLVSARARLQESLHLTRTVGDALVPATLADLAALAAAESRPQRAYCLAGAALSLRRAQGSIGFLPKDQARLDRHLQRARRALSEAVAAAAWAEGAAMTLDQAVALALDSASPGARTSPSGVDGGAQPGRGAQTDELTAREHQVAELIAHGFSNRQIATALAIAEGTTERHVSNILNKLGLTSRTQIGVWVTGRRLPQ